MRLVQVLPRARSEEGLSSYARALAAESPESDDHDLIELDGGDEAAEVFDRLAKGIEPGDALLLHYVGYGYHPRGVPSRLVEAFEHARRQRLGVRFGVMFHEVAAFGPPWRSSFWTRPLQVRLARRLLAAADGAVTSLERYRDMLTTDRDGGRVEVLPIPSTVGEPALVPGWAERAPRLVVFGSRGVRARAWEGERAALEATVRALAVEEVVDVGAPCGAPSSVGGVRVRSTGVLEAGGVSVELSAARAGFVAYPPDFLDKSTIYGAYLAHGLLPLCAWSGPRGREPRAGEAWIRARREGLEGGGEKWVAASARAREAYSGRSVRRHAELWRALLFG